MHDYHNSSLHTLYITSRHFSDLAASVEVTYFLNAGLCVLLYILKSGEKNTHFTGKVRGSGIYYVNESLHKDRTTNVCVRTCSLWKCEGVSLAPSQRDGWGGGATDSDLHLLIELSPACCHYPVTSKSHHSSHFIVAQNLLRLEAKNDGIWSIRIDQTNYHKACNVTLIPDDHMLLLEYNTSFFALPLFAVSVTKPIFLCSWILKGACVHMSWCVCENYSAAVLLQLIYLCWDQGRKLAWVVTHKSPSRLLKYGGIKGATQIYTLLQTVMLVCRQRFTSADTKDSRFRTTSPHCAHHCYIYQNINAASW